MRVWTALVLAAAMTLAVGEAGAQPRAKSRNQAPPPAVAAPPPAPVLPAGPPPEPLAAAIPRYAAFQGDISDLSARGDIASADQLEQALDVAAGQNREALLHGWLAYGALTAAQSREFVQAVRDTAGHYGQARFVRGLTLDPGYAQRLKGGDEAARLALTTSRADGERIYAVGARYKEMAYGMQKQRWAMQIATQQPARIDRLRQRAQNAATRTVAPEFAPRLVATPASVSPMSDPTAFGGGSFWDTLRLTPATSVAQIAAPTYVIRVNTDRVGAVNRMTTLAALYIIGATQDPAAQTDRLLTEDSSKNCFELAQMQFYQCLSAAHFRYENAFCLGEHALKDMGACIRDSSLVDHTAMSTPVAGTPLATAAPTH